MLGGSNNAAVWSLTPAEVEKDIVLQANIRESYHRKLYAYVNAATMNGIDAASAASGGQVWWVVMFEVIVGLSALGFIAFTALTIVFDRKERRQ